MAKNISYNSSARSMLKDGVDSLETENQIFIEKEKETVEVEKKEERKKVIEQKKNLKLEKFSKFL